MSLILKEIYDVTMSMWVELFFVSCFAIGFSMLRLSSKMQAKRSKPSSKSSQRFKCVHAEASAGKPSQALAAWRAVKTREATPCDTLKVVTQAFLDSEPSALVTEIIEHLSIHSSKLRDGKAAITTLEVVAQAGKE